MQTGAKVVSMQFVRRYTLTEHICPVCDTPFQGPKLRVYCSAECVRKAAWGRHGAEWNENRKQQRRKARSEDPITANNSGGEQ